MVKHMLKDPYILSVIGETIFDDDELFSKLSGFVDDSKKKSKKKSKKGKKRSRRTRTCFHPCRNR